MADIISKSEIKGVEALDLVADAMMESYSKRLSRFGYFEGYLDTHHKVHPGDIFKEATASQCSTASEETVYWLADNYPEFFEHLLTITTELIPPKSWLHRESQDFHTYFFAQDKKGVWYAASPANHGKNNDREYATTIFRDHNLSDVLGKIQKRDGIIFPNEGEIMKALGKQRSFYKTGVNTIRILEIKKTEKGMEEKFK